VTWSWMAAAIMTLNTSASDASSFSIHAKADLNIRATKKSGRVANMVDVIPNWTSSKCSFNICSDINHEANPIATVLLIKVSNCQVDGHSMFLQFTSMAGRKKYPIAT